MASTPRSGKIFATAVILLPVYLSQGTAAAAPAAVSIGLENRFSDNVAKTRSDTESDIESRITLNVDKSGEPGRCNYSLGGGIGYAVWHEDTFDPETFTDGRASGQCQLTPYLVWQASDRIKQVSQDNRDADTPDNLTRKNTFSTGPVYSLRLTEVDVVRLSASYENVEFEEPEEADSNRVIWGISYSHSFNATFQAGLSSSVERTELDTEEELDRESVSLTFGKRWASTSLSGSLGINQLENRKARSEVSSEGVTGNLRLNRQVTDSSSLSLAIDRQLTDQTSTVGLDFDNFSFDLENTSAVEVTTLSLSYRNSLSSGGSLTSQFDASRTDFVESDEREETQRIGLNYSRPISSVASLSAQTNYRLSSFGDGSDDRVGNASVAYSYSITSSLRARASIGHELKESEVDRRKYDASWILLSLRYAFQ